MHPREGPRAPGANKEEMRCRGHRGVMVHVCGEI